MSDFDLRSFMETEFAEHDEVFRATQDAVSAPFAVLLEACRTSVEGGGKLIFFGNGGSAADAQHLATELTVRYSVDRAPIAALSLTTDSSALTAIGNDVGFDHLFARQMHAVGHAGDVAIGISTSGRSDNVILGLKAAHEIGAVAAGFTGGDGGAMTTVADPLLIVPSVSTARIQEMHILIGQMLCGALEASLGLV